MPLSAWSTPSAIVQFASPTLLNASMFFPSNNVVQPPFASTDTSVDAALNTKSPATPPQMRFIVPPVLTCLALTNTVGSPRGNSTSRTVFSGFFQAQILEL